MGKDLYSIIDNMNKCNVCIFKHFCYKGSSFRLKYHIKYHNIRQENNNGHCKWFVQRMEEIFNDVDKSSDSKTAK